MRIYTSFFNQDYLYRMRIYLIGFMGAGKTYFGQALAQRLEADFVDTDQCIEDWTGMQISELFEVMSEEYFRKVESFVLQQTFQLEKSTVIATGGGTPCFHNGMQKMRENGTVIFLDPPVEVLQERLQKDTTRPLLQHRNDLNEYIQTKLTERRPVYEQADYCCKGKSLDVFLHWVNTIPKWI